VSVARRAALLVALALAGLAVGVAGHAATGTAWWFVALPIAVAAGWLFVADPTRCEGPVCPPPGAERAHERADREGP
jgi:hypothetical protein